MNQIEVDILKWLAQEYPEYEIENIIQQLQVTEREDTGVGLITTFKLNVRLKAQGANLDTCAYHLIGPLIKSTDLSDGAETYVTIENNMITCIEMLSRGAGSPANIHFYELVDEDVNFVDDIYSVS
ncbi:hypothetical protein [uncultured Shewanella sp.]|uniref:hypothetical protein n=1 Tax=uncultured Shewanella sp. TaxID=173975 RepID=UPI00262796B4|nr:hypothetical protein [uncultured Shewanella sp.]